VGKGVRRAHEEHGCLLVLHGEPSSLCFLRSGSLLTIGFASPPHDGVCLIRRIVSPI
jgi:hypothetical protein